MLKNITEYTIALISRSDSEVKISNFCISILSTKSWTNTAAANPLGIIKAINLVSLLEMSFGPRIFVRKYLHKYKIIVNTNILYDSSGNMTGAITSERES